MKIKKGCQMTAFLLIDYKYKYRAMLILHKVILIKFQTYIYRRTSLIFN